MFEIGFSELVLVMIIGLIVLGPERLPVAVKTVAGWIRAMRTLASTVQNELTKELKLQELQDSLKKVEQSANLQNISPELKASMDELRSATEAIARSYQDIISPNQHDSIKQDEDKLVNDVNQANSAEQTSEPEQKLNELAPQEEQRANTIENQATLSIDPDVDVSSSSNKSEADR